MSQTLVSVMANIMVSSEPMACMNGEANDALPSNSEMSAVVTNALKLTQTERSPNNIDDQTREPDGDALKMFVGQIPRDWDEDDCRRLLEPFGDVYAINLLKDKRTAKSKGCCFVTFYTRRAALEAQNALHNIRTLPSCHHPIQMKPADTENRNERKLFIGMLSKALSEQDVRTLFAPFGVIEECSILKDNSGQSKGCAFVTYSSRSSASNAIKAMNHSTTMEGCTSSLVVKFADTQKDKEARKGSQTLMQHLWSQTSSPLSASLVSNPYLTLAAINAAQQQQQQLAATLALQQQYLNSDISLATAIASNPLLMAAALTGSPHTKVSTQSTVASLNQRYANNKLDMLSGVREQLGFSTALPTASTLPAVQHLSAVTPNTPKQMEGPEGANLFIYHLPPEFTDTDLIATFSPFGNVISAKVFIDKNSNLSKCFGFVSYDNALSAQSAIQSMHGFQIRNKRLKVQLKKTREKPY